MEIYKIMKGKSSLSKLLVIILMMMLMTMELVEADDENEGNADDIPEMDLGILNDLVFNMTDGDHPMEEGSQDNVVHNWNDGIPEYSTEGDQQLYEEILESLLELDGQTDLLFNWNDGVPQHPSEEPNQENVLEHENDGSPQHPVEERRQDDLLHQSNDGTTQSPSQGDPDTDVKFSPNDGTAQSPSQGDTETDVKFSPNEPESEDLSQETISDSVSNFVRITRFPENLTQHDKVEVMYYCEVNSVVVVDLTIMLVDSDTYFTTFYRAWTCQGQGVDGKPKTKRLTLRLPDTLVYRPDYFLKADSTWLVSWCKIRAWLIDETVWFKGHNDEIYASSKSRDMHKVTVPPPYSRPYRNPSCTVWIWPYVQKLHSLSDSSLCPVEQESVTLLNYPAVFSGNYHGILRELSPYSDWRLERDRLQRRHFPVFSIEMWVYILDYCPMHYLIPASSCGLFVHMTGDGTFLNPVILLNKDGNIQIDMKGSTGFIAMRSHGLVPKNTWVRILFSFQERKMPTILFGIRPLFGIQLGVSKLSVPSQHHPSRHLTPLSKWILHVNYGPQLKDGFWTSHTFAENLYMDDTEALMSMGGIDWKMGSFVGYMGRVVYHRQRAMVPDQLSIPDPSHPMFELHLSRRREKCVNFLSWMDSAVDVFQKYQRYAARQQGNTCSNEPLLFFMRFLHDPEDTSTCPPKNPYKLTHHYHVNRLLRKAVSVHSLSRNFLDGDLEAYSRNFMNDSQAILLGISDELLSIAESVVSETGLKKSMKIVHLLRQASCLGNDDAMFSLAVMLNNGVGCEPDEIQSLAYFMLGVLNRHRLSVMALGHRHVMGIDGAPVDKDVAFMYYKQVADMTRLDKELHKETEIATESIRLIDEARIEAQTSEVGDLFLWLKNQAERGVATAQNQLGAMMYHGAQGIKRNLQTAMNIFKDGAETGNYDAMYSYGIMQYRGMGAQANKTEGRRMMEKAAEMNNPGAVSALGWVALEVDKNYSQAFELFHLSKKLGHMDSGYYLGFMHQFGLVPNQTVDLDKALEEYYWSAKSGQVDAGTMYSFLLSRGTPRHRRSAHFAVEWARFIAEKNSYLAKALRTAINAFREGNYDLALYWYLMLADAGLEVASFNLAYLCEHNQNGVRKYISKECEWKHYNLSTQRESHFVDAYSYIKMGDYHWYGCLGHRNLAEAANQYSLAAVKGNPQALFNLAYMVEEGVDISPVIWWRLHLTSDVYTNKVRLLLELYARCRESRQSEAFMPCCLAWFRIWCLDVWDQYHIYMKVSSFLGIFVTMAMTTYLVYKHCLQRRIDKQTEEARKAEEEERNRLECLQDIEEVEEGDTEDQFEDI